jgi:hypothetical protein
MPPVGLHRPVAREERRLGGEELGGVGRLAARDALVELPRRLADRELRCVQPHVRLGEREREPLVLPDRAAEHDALAAVLDGSPHRGTADAERLRRDQDPLGVEPVEQVGEALALLADATAHRHTQTVVAHLARHHGVAAELRDRADVDLGPLQVDEQQGHPVGRLGALLARCGAHQQQAHLAERGLGGPHLGPVHHVLVAVAHGSCTDRRGVGAGVGLGDAERDVQVAGGDPGQHLSGELGRTVPTNRLHAEDRQVHGRAAVHRSAGRSDLLEHHRRLADPLTAAAVLLGDRDAHPTACSERLVEVPRELVGLVLRRPVLVREVGADPADALADRLVIRRAAEVHRSAPSHAADSAALREF